VSTPLPCQSRPDFFIQQGEDPDWDTQPSTAWALNACERLCPTPLHECAMAALEAGTVDGQRYPRVASGVIQAGIICKGDSETRKALTELAYPNGDAPEWVEPAPDDEFCMVCGRTFVANDVPLTLGVTCRRHTPAYPLCSAHYMAARRAGTLKSIPPVAVPDVCQGPCGRPMCKRANPLPDHVIHESGGLCAACCRAARRGAAA
jgi:hypothetical protein